MNPALLPVFFALLRAWIVVAAKVGDLDAASVDDWLADFATDPDGAVVRLADAVHQLAARL